MTLPAGIRVAWREIPAGTARRETSRALLAEMLPGVRFTSRCSSCGGDHGRVRVEGADAAVSVSYAEGWAVAVTASGYERVGADAVPAHARGLERVLLGVADARAWARVEAVLKADGRGLAVDPRRVEVSVDGAAWAARVPPALSRVEIPVRDDSGARQGADRWRGWDLDGPDGVVLAVAIAAREVDAAV